MSPKFQEIPIDLSVEADQKQKVPVEQCPSLVPRLRERYEQKITEISRVDLVELGFSDQEIEAGQHFFHEFETLVRESADTPELFLAKISQKGIGIFTDSVYLKSRVTPVMTLAKIVGTNKGMYEGALFATPDITQKQIVALGSEYTNTQVIAELTRAAMYRGAIFLDKNPSPKSIFHEGAHALQMINGLDMDAGTEQTKLKREIEVNIALIRLKQARLLTAVTSGKFDEGKGPFGPTATLDTGDIFQEVDYFFLNKGKLTGDKG